MAVVVQWLSCVQLFAAPWTAARQASPSFVISQGSLLLLLVCTSCSLPSHGCFPYTSVPMGTQQILKGTLWRSQGFLLLWFFFFFYWLCLVFGVVCGIFIHGLRTLMQHAGSSSLTRDQTWAPALAAWSLPWTSREVLWWFFLYSAFSSLVFCPVSASYLGVPGPSS